jgi:hypothetical protein
MTSDHQLRVEFMLKSKSVPSINFYHLSMERHCRSTERQHHGANDSGVRRTKEAARASGIGEKLEAYKKGIMISKHDGIRRNHPPEFLANQLSGDNDYVRKWLAGTDEEANQQRSEYCGSRQRPPSKCPLFRNHNFGRLLLTLYFRSLFRS